MTMFSFRVDDEEAADVEQWASILGIGRSEFLREALHRHLIRLRSEVDCQTWASAPLTSGEQALSDIADWGPAEDWTDWADATG